jgi:thiamine biosynthesis lipoprotein
MGTTYTIKVVDAPAGVTIHALQQSIDTVLQRIDRSMSQYRSDSEISRFNAARSTDWFAVDEDLLAVVKIAQRVSSQSQGAFDITVAPLVNAWGFGATHTDSIPDANTLAALAAEVGYRKLETRDAPAAIRKQVPELQIDVNGIAPGYAVDLLAETFGRLGIKNFVIDVGGEVLGRGHNAQDKPWRIAVERPSDESAAPYAFVQLRDASVTTSGEYRHFYFKNGRRYSHTIDPRTLQPVEHDLAAVVVVGPTSTEIDAWATALNVLGGDEGLALARARRIPALFIREQAGVLRGEMTGEFESYLSDE